VAAIEQHFRKARVELKDRMEALMANVIKPRLTLVKRYAMTDLSQLFL